jgi:hypothetical protein
VALQDHQLGWANRKQQREYARPRGQRARYMLTTTRGGEPTRLRSARPGRVKSQDCAAWCRGCACPNAHAWKLSGRPQAPGRNPMLQASTGRGLATIRCLSPPDPSRRPHLELLGCQPPLVPDVAPGLREARDGGQLGPLGVGRCHVIHQGLGGGGRRKTRWTCRRARAGKTAVAGPRGAVKKAVCAASGGARLWRGA